MRIIKLSTFLTVLLAFSHLSIAAEVPTDDIIMTQTPSGPEFTPKDKAVTIPEPELPSEGDPCIEPAPL